MDSEKKKDREIHWNIQKTFLSAIHVILQAEYKVILQLKPATLHTVLEQLQLTFK